jgi:hypothetical protein
MLLPRFSAPGNLKETSADALTAWSSRLSTLFDDVTGPSRHFYNATKADTPAAADVAAVTWPASPGRLLSKGLSSEKRWKLADSDRNQQDEYCEWSVLRDAGGKITRVTFTTETPDYYDHLMDTDQQLLLKLYKDATGKTVPIGKLRDKNGLFLAANEFNSATNGTIVHLIQRSNNLRAAVILAAEATVLRKDKAGKPVTHAQTLVACAGLGDATRHSDPQIAAAINNLVATKKAITLKDPAGLYLDGIVTTGMDTPDDTDPQTFWTVERGSPGLAMRARFEVPSALGYKVGDITVGGVAVAFGAQLADRVQVRINAVAKPANFQLTRKVCLPSSGL